MSILEALADAWNKGDLERFMAGYWQSPQLVFFSGSDVIKGWQAVYNHYKKRYQTEGREMGTLTFSDVEPVFLDLDKVCLCGHWLVEASEGRLGGLFTIIAKKFSEGWRIVHDHTSGSSH